MTVSSVPPTHAAPSRQDTERLLSGIWSLNRLIARELNPQLEAQHGIDMRVYGFLKIIEHGSYPKQIAEELKLPGSLVSRHLDQLQSLGLIERHIDEHDSRRVCLKLTPQGQATRAAAEEGMHRAVSERLGHLSPEGLRSFLDTLEGLTRRPGSLQAETERP